MAKKSKKVKEFQEEIKKPILNNQATFYELILKKPEDLTEEEIRILFYRQSYLSDDERYKFRNILVRENLTEAEEARFHRIFTDKAFNKYFPLKDKVEEHYNINFLNGRSN